MGKDHRALVIVESPAKARTISNYLGEGFIVESSIGHIRDLPKNAAEIPPAYKDKPWARLGVDVENDFRPLYIVSKSKKAQVSKLKKLLKEADELYLATDEDREGESIAWHLLEVLKPKVPVKRMVFHEITRRAIDEALKQPREVDRRLVDAQEARRILDRLYGYEVSPVLWKKVMPRLSAGRVQSVAVRMVVERERERMAFVPARYWDLTGTFEAEVEAPVRRFEARMVALDGRRLATGKDFGPDGKLKREEVVALDEARARALAGAMAPPEGAAGARARVAAVERKPYRRTPAPPFMTSTLQQEAARKLRFTSRKTMQVAQRLYETGYITYMRTDSTTLSQDALAAARTEIAQRYGAECLPDRPRTYKKKVKNAQEAHEAIRPAGDRFRHPDEVRRELGRDEARLYELIWKRTIASQMKDAEGESVTIRIEVDFEEGGAAHRAEFTTSGTVITFPGFLKVYVEGSDETESEGEGGSEEGARLPPVKE
ncbi:MAG: type I DNA topoisomerase, partial [Deltaproteobacteria bacterium]